MYVWKKRQRVYGMVEKATTNKSNAVIDFSTMTSTWAKVIGNVNFTVRFQLQAKLTRLLHLTWSTRKDAPV